VKINVRLKGETLTGFSHGAAGVAYALLKLFAVTQQEEFLGAACEGIGYERSVFIPDVRNWPDLRKLVQVQEGIPISYVSGWCHGATGIGLARLGIHPPSFRGGELLTPFSDPLCNSHKAYILLTKEQIPWIAFE
jgi:lantibiotic modifying enzyme